MYLLHQTSALTQAYNHLNNDPKNTFHKQSNKIYNPTPKLYSIRILKKNVTEAFDWLLRPSEPSSGLWLAACEPSRGESVQWEPGPEQLYWWRLIKIQAVWRQTDCRAVLPLSLCSLEMVEGRERGGGRQNLTHTHTHALTHTRTLTQVRTHTHALT